jgi:hypothetical protein
MTSRLVVVAAFAAATLAAGFIAFSTGVFPSPTGASADSAETDSTVFRVTSLAWPEKALGLAATDSAVLWEERDADAEAAGLWIYDVDTRRPTRVLGRGATGKAVGFPDASGEVIVWAAWPGRRGVGTPRIEAYDTLSTRHWTVAERGSDPSTTGDIVFWVERHGAGPKDDAVRGVHTITDEEYEIPARGRVRDLAVWSKWAAWISGRGGASAVWAGSHREATRQRLANDGATVAIDRKRVVWAAAGGQDTTAVVAWDRRSHRSKVLCRVAGTASSLSLSRRFAVWVTSREATGPQVWAYDFKRGLAYAVSANTGEQASPVIVADTVYWADRRSGNWELYGRPLQP